jgi:exopolyphosphatase/guanosine-5'-triphosphate,3'-diphosphate pyrophosphatase
MRVAAVDLGTNSTRLLVADVDGGRVEDVARETRITRLGEGVDERRRLLPLPIARVRNTLSDFRRQAESLGAERTLLVATSAVRDAENGGLSSARSSGATGLRRDWSRARRRPT